jgi:hypothetical protein
MATTQVHSDWLERQFDGTDALDLDAAVGGETIKLGIFTEAAIDPDVIDQSADLTAVAAGDDWTGPVTLANIACGLNGSDNLVFDGDDPSTIAQDADNGFADGRSLAIFDNTGDFILLSHIEDSVFGNVGGPITITFNASGLWVLTI